jgi:hypothetical protein
MPIYRQRPKEARLSVIRPRAVGVTKNRFGSAVGVVTTRASELCRRLASLPLSSRMWKVRSPSRGTETGVRSN